MTLTDTPVAGVYCGRLTAFQDSRGLFAKLFASPEVASLWQPRLVRQVNFSETEATGTIRGLHLQYPPHAEMKLIVCISGQVFDVAADLRADSPTAARHVHAILSPLDVIVIPEGCAHGFQALLPHSRLLYLHSADYAPASEGGIRYDDSSLGIAWPLPPANVSERDLRLPDLAGALSGVTRHV